MTKQCRKCKETKPLDGFYKNSKGKHGVTSRCKECCRAYSQNPEVKARQKARIQSPERKAKIKAYQKAFCQQRKDFVDQYAKDTGQGKCVKCGSTENLVWGHIDPTTESIAISDLYKKTTENILAELKKRQRLCKSCHTAKSTENGKQCKKCGETKPLDMFYKSCKGKHGVSSRCKDCKRAYHKAHNQTPERKEYMRECRREYMRKQRQKAKEVNFTDPR